LFIPSAHRLNLLVQDLELENELRKPCEDYIKRIVKRLNDENTNKMTDVSDLNNIGDTILIERS